MKNRFTVTLLILVVVGGVAASAYYFYRSSVMFPADSVEFYEVEGFLPVKSLGGGTIHSQEQLETHVETSVPAGWTESDTQAYGGLPDIDFETHFLAYVYASASGCNVSFKPSLTKIDASTLLFKVEMAARGLCEVSRAKTIKIAVPVAYAGYKFIFETEVVASDDPSQR